MLNCFYNNIILYTITLYSGSYTLIHFFGNSIKEI